MIDEDAVVGAGAQCADAQIGPVPRFLAFFRGAGVLESAEAGSASTR